MAAAYDYDVLYLGSGHGTFDGAIPLAKSGQRVGVIEADMIGGTCPNYGCNAKITLDAPVVLQRLQERLSAIVPGEAKIDWHQNYLHKQEVIEALPQMIGATMKDAGIDLIHGKGEFQDAHTILVDGKPKTAAKIVIATGLRPHRLNIPGDELAHDSRDFMALQTLPERIAIIGAGYISMEFATMANAAGADVTILMHGDRALRQFDPQAVDIVVKDLEDRGVTFVANARVASLSQEGDETLVHYADGKTLTTDWVLDASGRIPNTEGIGLEKIGVKYDAHGIIVDDHLQTSVAGIYASGDVLKKSAPQSTPAAAFESNYLTKSFIGETQAPIVYPVMPKVVFTSPRIAQVGVTKKEAQENHDLISEEDLTKDWYWQVDREKIAKNTLIFDHEHHLTGVVNVSDRAEDIVNQLLPLIQFKMTKDQINQLIYLFPTLQHSILGKL